ncbi:MAG: hypothetical protein LBP59_02585, partial [Planctomycetaceae bacterium]|nr:hypothetical protein [Planctomycetaceae bacterium]
RDTIINLKSNFKKILLLTIKKQLKTLKTIMTQINRYLDHGEQRLGVNCSSTPKICENKTTNENTTGY